jgi:hypothetical protein
MWQRCRRCHGLDDQWAPDDGGQQRRRRDDRDDGIHGDYEVARVPTNDGVHSLEADAGFMVTVVGYDDADSYAYLGGTGTGVINPNPEG